MSFVNPLSDRTIVFVTAVGDAEGARGAAAALACAGADFDRPALLVDVEGRPPRPTLLASAAAQAFEKRLRAHLPQARIAARGQLCQLAVCGDSEGCEVAAAAATVARGAAVVVHLPPELLQALLAESRAPRPSGVLLRADLDRERPLVGLLARDLLARGLDVRVQKSRLSWVGERRALFGALPSGVGAGLPERLTRRLLDPSRDRGAVPVLVGEAARSSA
jgi:hypothetical protein